MDLVHLRALLCADAADEELPTEYQIVTDGTVNLGTGKYAKVSERSWVLPALAFSRITASLYS